jgi:myosin-1
MLILRQSTPELLDDCCAGHTKLFIGSPNSLFRLEELRSAEMPRLILLLQRMFRGALARRECKRRRAVRKIWCRYMRYKLRSYILALCDAFRYLVSLLDSKFK